MPDTQPRIPARQRVPAAARRDALIAAAVHEFAHGGLHGTPVDRIARRVGVAQPYVFSLFATKRDLFVAAVERCFDRITQTFTDAATAFHAGDGPPDCQDVLGAMGRAYVALLESDRDLLLLQHQSFAACDDLQVRAAVRAHWALLTMTVNEISQADDERVDEFFRHGMALNVQAAMGVPDLSVACDWVQSVGRGQRSRV